MPGSKLPVAVVYDGHRYAVIEDGTRIQIDAQDAHLLAMGHWRYSDRRGVYAHVSLGSRAAGMRLYILHRLILGAKDPRRDRVLHINGDKRDCRRANLTADERAVCPFTGGRLDEMYWQQGWRLRRIGEEAAALTGHPRVSDMTVRRWLETAGIRLRTRSELSKRVMRMPHVKIALRESLKRRWARIRRGEVPMLPQNARAMPERVRRLGIAAARQKRLGKREQTWPMLTCDLCSRTFRRRACYVRRNERQGRHGQYCSKHCAGRAGHLPGQNQAGAPMGWLTGYGVSVSGYGVSVSGYVGTTTGQEGQ